MAIAHICLQCGFDLARVRSVREPHYRLSLVTCPKCETVAVRRVHPIWRGWKTFVRLDAVLRVLLVQLFFFFLLSALTLITTLVIIDEFERPAKLIARDAFPWSYVLTFGVLAPITGAWLTAGLSHLHQRLTFIWLGWLAILLAEMGLFIVFCAAVQETPFDAIPRQPNTFWSDSFELILFPAASIQSFFMVAAIAGIPVGRAALRLNTWALRSVWRWRRRRRRLAHSA